MSCFRRRGWCVLIALSGAFLPLFAESGTAVIYDSGQTQPLAPYLTIFDEDLSDASVPAPEPPVRRGISLETLLPVHTPEMTPGAVRPRRLQPGTARFTRPLFLIGADPRSLAWLSAHRQALIRLGAVGMLIEAATVDQVQAIADLAQGLEIMPASGSAIAKTLSLRHYPVLISRQGIEQ